MLNTIQEEHSLRDCWLAVTDYGRQISFDLVFKGSDINSS